ncbi:MAG TPA: hypothetical protein VFY26_10040 [Anaerolineales bacterium]|nr:hypothetical protein [Anaerolineales bacterium]
MILITTFEPAFASSLPQTLKLLTDANLVVHPGVSRIVLHGSRGLAGGDRPDSDVDLSLIVDLPQEDNFEHELDHAVRTTLDHWQAAVELDLAVIFDIKDCELRCFEQTTWQERVCRLGGVDCFGLYKIQKGFQGIVTGAGIKVELMYPCVTIWQR